MILISEEELGEIISLTEDACNSTGWVKGALPYIKKRQELIDKILQRKAK